MHLLWKLSSLAKERAIAFELKFSRHDEVLFIPPKADIESVSYVSDDNATQQLQPQIMKNVLNFALIRFFSFF
jgi:hypothetical protein